MTATEYTEHVGQWSDDLFRFALRCCNERERSEDVVQEAFAALWERRDEVEVDKGKGFLFMVAQRRLRDSYRHDTVRQENMPSIAYEQETETHPTEQFELRDAIEKALQQLTEVQRAILQLHDVEGYSCNEIKSIIGLNVNQVQVYLFRARVKMKRILKDYIR